MMRMVGAMSDRHRRRPRSASPSAATSSELRAIKIVWTPRVIRFRKDRMRIVTSLVQPLLFLFVLGSGLGTRSPRAATST